MDIEATVTSPTDKELKLRAKWLLVWAASDQLFAAGRCASYCTPESALAQNANGYLNWISASRLALTLTSAVVAGENGLTMMSRPSHEQISISLHFATNRLPSW